MNENWCFDRFLQATHGRRTKLGITSLFGPCVLRGVHGKGAISCHFSCHLFILKEEKKKKFRVKRKREAKVTPHMVQTAKARAQGEKKEGTKIEVAVEVPGVYLPHGCVHG
ncbi:hypothetical protein NEUTE2DRAFT_62601 [Neurospora tetrasperma FGSC 2509]|nr:hypothetical protein NEUTE2DRAFT_62601 [Neurospora tetrasperma FGSC 2509]